MNITSQNGQEGVLYAVYGTLRQGWGNNRLLQNEFSEYLGTQKTEPKFTMVSMGGFPGLVAEGNTAATIEVFRVTSKDVERSLDRLEGYPGWYDKIKIPTQWGEAFVYTQTMNQVKGCSVIACGDWNQYQEERFRTVR
jgi:gamma-glutamylcyclotransferase (GGCT)/AIG2-like uncharacterized protein YtfP